MFGFLFISSVSFAQNNPSANDEEAIKSIISQYFNNYFDSFKYLKTANTSNIIEENDDTLLYKIINECEVEVSREFGIGYKDYSYSIDYKDILINNNQAQVGLLIDLDYQCQNTLDIKSGIYNVDYDFKLKHDGNKWFITKIDSGFDEFEQYKASYREKNKAGLKGQDLQKKMKEEKLNDIVKMKKQFEESKLMPSPHPDTSTTGSDSVTAAASYTYFSPRGTAYAERFAESSQSSRFFYTAGSGGDCTNFVSQCVWAAFGGYVEGNDTKTKSNIANKVRMTSTWYAGTGGGSSNWESVSSLWNYATQSKTLGPNGYGFNNDRVYTYINPRYEDIGEVYQVRNGSSGSYAHSVYTTDMNPNPTSYSDIFVSQHSYDKLNRPLTNLISSWGGSNCYMRNIDFTVYTSYFNS
ncbi:amidase domain-containing protein [Desulfoscipio gibsoniae]|nr:amidase domain-containing protein [Desulfoscipio gibsoniae]